MAEVESLFGTSSLTPPRPRIPKPAEPSADALGAALLAGILQDLSTLKEAAGQQGEMNRSLHDFAMAQQRLIESLAQTDRDQAAFNQDQMDGNAAKAICNAEVLKLFDGFNQLAERLNKMADVIAGLDARLEALEGKRKRTAGTGRGRGRRMSVSLSDFKYRDSAVLEIVPPGGTELIGAIEFAGPAHPATRALVERSRKVSLPAMRGAPQRSLEALELENAKAIAARILGWSGIKRRDDAGEVVEQPYTEEAAVEMLANPALGWLFGQCVDFLSDDRNFLPARR